MDAMFQLVHPPASEHGSMRAAKRRAVGSKDDPIVVLALMDTDTMPVGASHPTAPTCRPVPSAAAADANHSAIAASAVQLDPADTSPRHVPIGREEDEEVFVPTVHRIAPERASVAQLDPPMMVVLPIWNAPVVTHVLPPSIVYWFPEPSRYLSLVLAARDMVMRVAEVVMLMVWPTRLVHDPPLYTNCPVVGSNSPAETR
mmetsp:Transcript_37375/g.73036  ORF Transcript_37375/g.73036 Transcript_37375/m.73036 type:complete len:201 (-) Transcript_37375:1378-1980(-)